MEGAGANGSGEECKKAVTEEAADHGTEASGSADGGGGGLVGAYVGRSSSGVVRVFLGKVVSYDEHNRLYRVIYEDGHQGDLEHDAVGKILMADDEVRKLTRRKRRLDHIDHSGGLNRPNTRSRKGTPDTPALNVIDRSTAEVPASIGQLSFDDVSCNADSSSDSCDHARVPAAAPGSCTAEAQMLPVELPPSSGDIAVPEGSVAYLLSTYSFLRSFSLQLFLSPFGFDDYVGSLNCNVQNSLMDSIHLSLLRALGRHLQMVSSEGSAVASKCLRYYDWMLLDMLTWPAFLVEYFYFMGYMKCLNSKEFIDIVLHCEYYRMPVDIKLKVLQLLCDDVINSGELRAELAMREGVEEDNEDGLDADFISEGLPASLCHKPCKALGWKDAVASVESVVPDHQHGNTVVSEPGSDTSTNSQDKNSDECCLCGMDGTLICCDGCPSAYHSRCIGLNKAFLPEGLWFCPECNINKLGQTSRIGRGGTRGADIFGTDPYGYTFVGTCNYLLVFATSLNEEFLSRYYNQGDIPKVLSAISSSDADAFAYTEINRGISEYFDIPVFYAKLEKPESVRDTLSDKDPAIYNFASTSSRRDTTIMNNSGDASVSNTILGISETIVGMCVGTEAPADASVIVQVGVSDPQKNFTEKNDVCANKIPETVDEIMVNMNDKNTSCGVASPTKSKVLLSKQINAKEQFGSLVTDFTCSNPHLCTEKSNLVNDVTFSSKNGSIICKEEVDSSIYSTKSCSFGGFNGSGDLSNLYDVMHKNKPDVGSIVPVSFKPLAYINQYIQGDVAASAAASLAVLLTEDNKSVDFHVSSNQKKVAAANIALQMKAFSIAVMNFLWPCSEKKLMDVPRERCGWCIACKGPTTNKKGCLLNLTASNAIKWPARNITLRASKHHESHVPSIAAQMLIMEENLRGLMAGPFLDVEYTNQWQKQVREANSCWVLRSLLLELEKNVRGIAFTGGWFKIVDEFIQNFKSSNGVCRTGGNQKRLNGGRKSKRQSEISLTSPDDKGKDVQSWRKGKLSKFILQICTLPRSLVKKAARQGGIKRISAILYSECSAFCRRSRQFVWRAAVERSENTSQLALQVRYLDAHIRWKEFTRPEQIPLDSKGFENDLIVFRNASVSAKKNLENKMMYALNFGNQKHLPLRITKNVLESEKTQDGNKRLWFSEGHIPLYLIKEYEETFGMCQVHPIVSTVHHMVKFYRRQFKFYWGDVFTYLMHKEKENTRKCLSCQKDVRLRYAVKCKDCEDYFHLNCSTPCIMKGEDGPKFPRLCKLCHFATSPAVIENSQMDCSLKLSLKGNYQLLSQPLMGGMHQNGLHNFSLPVRKMKVNSESKSSKPDSCSESKTKRSGGAWFTHGIIWRRKKHSTEDGKEFLMENVLLKVEEGSYPSKKPICCLCEMPYDPNLMYVCCQCCKNWYHADAVLLEEDRLPDVVGFKCCKCRRKSSPKCPYSEVNYVKLEEQPKHCNALDVGNAMCIPPKSSSSTASISSETENFVSVEFNPLLHSCERVDLVEETDLGIEDKFDASLPSCKGQQKLFVRRSQVQQNAVDEWNADQIGNQMHEAFPESLENMLESSPVSTSWNIPASLEWDSLEVDGIGNFDYENVCCEENLPDGERERAGDMMYEPQTYFSFTELLESAEDVPVGLMDNRSVLPTLNAEATYFDRSCHNLIGEKEILVNEESAFDGLECQKCKLYKPSPDLTCEICRLCIHSHCSPWVEENAEISTDSNWRCGNCREWRAYGIWQHGVGKS